MRGRENEFRPGKVVYHCVDRWDAFAMYDSKVMAKADEACCRSADVVIASSRDLEERCRRFNGNVHLITHGVDHAHFAQALAELPRPSDLPPGPVLGFFGLISEWVDQELLLTLAAAVPEVTIVLIGQADVDISRLKAEPNIVLLGPKPFADLPSYIAHFSVGVIPFVVNELTRAVNPIKLREMLSAGCPLVSTDLPEVVACGGTRAVEVASNHEAFIAAVRRFVANPLAPAERAVLSAGMAGETWAAKVDEILAAFSGETPA